MTDKTTKLLLTIPMKDPVHSKTRLGVLLSPHQRAQLAIRLFRNVVETAKIAISQLPKQEIDIAVVSSSPTIHHLSQQWNVKWIDDESASGLSQAVAHAAQVAANERYDNFCFVPGDLADPSVPDLIHLFEYAREASSAAICPAKDMGTNALLLPLPTPIAFQFGERSFHHHYRALVDAGLLTTILPLNSLRRDVDTVHDWQDWKDRCPDMAIWSERQ